MHWPRLCVPRLRPWTRYDDEFVKLAFVRITCGFIEELAIKQTISKVTYIMYFDSPSPPKIRQDTPETDTRRYFSLLKKLELNLVVYVEKTNIRKKAYQNKKKRYNLCVNENFDGNCDKSNAVGTKY